MTTGQAGVTLELAGVTLELARVTLGLARVTLGCGVPVCAASAHLVVMASVLHCDALLPRAPEAVAQTGGHQSARFDDQIRASA